MFDANLPGLIIGIVGTGTMGRGIAQIAVQAGLTVRLFDARPGGALEAKSSVLGTLSSLAAKGKIPAETAREAEARLVVVSSEEELAGCALVVEAIVEDLRSKRDLFGRLERITGPDCVLATNTSSLSVTAIAAACARPERVAGYHFFNPVPLMKVVEVIPGARTAAPVVDALVSLSKRLGHRPVRATDTPGFVVNHAGRGFGTEALRILQDGIASFDAIDRILKDVAGFRMGPFELLDLTGLDVSHPVMESIYSQFYEEPRFRPSYLLRQRLAAGLLGRKTGRGFYEYADGKPVSLAESGVPKAEPRPVWISAVESPSRERLVGIVQRAGWSLETGETPSPEALCVLAPLGDDATTSALRLKGVRAEHAVAVDLFFKAARRHTLMTTPVTTREMRDAAHVLLAADGTPVSVIHDSPGFVAPRVLATIVNIACELVQQGIATPEDLDAAVSLGLGYPKGPLAWGDELGPARVLHVLEGLFAATGDPRYRPSLWLSRRARLGVSLTLSGR